MEEGLPDDEMASGVDVNLVLQGDAGAAVKLASAYFLVAGRDSFSDPKQDEDADGNEPPHRQ